MSQPILSIRDERENKTKAIANVLPARIHHNGPVDPIESFWTPTQGEDDSRTAYLRGRKLQGKRVKLPGQCHGVVLQRRDDPAGSRRAVDANAGGDDDVVELGPETGTMQVTAEFDEMVVWGHEAAVDAAGDPYVRSMDEWLEVSGKIHEYSSDEAATEKK